MVDLHLHSTYSDGAVPPADLVRRAVELGLRAIALTDHDTIEGNGELLRCGAGAGLPVIPGIEISTHCRGMGPIESSMTKSRTARR